MAFSCRPPFSPCQEHGLENRGLGYKCPWITREVLQLTLKIFSWFWIKFGEDLLNILFDSVVVQLSVALSSTHIHVVYILRR
jgi:hypothetical protein